MSANTLPPITDEDKPAVEAMIKRLVRYRKRQTANAGAWSTSDLTDAIESLQRFGAMKGWWEITQ